MVKKERHIRGGVEKTYIKVIEAYRPGPGEPPKQRVVKTFGWLEDADDPAALLAEAKEFDRQWMASARDTARVELQGSIRLCTGENALINYGCRYLTSVYDELGLESFAVGDTFKVQVIRCCLPRRDCLYLGIRPQEGDTVPRRRADLKVHLERRFAELTGAELKLKDAPAAQMTAEAIFAVIDHFMGEDRLPRPRLVAVLDAAVCTKLPGRMYHFIDFGTEQELKNGTLSLVLTEKWQDYITLQKYFHVDFRYIYAKEERIRDFLNDMTIFPPKTRRRRKPLVP